MSNFSLKDALLHPLSAHFYKEKIVALDYLYKNDYIVMITFIIKF